MNGSGSGRSIVYVLDPDGAVRDGLRQLFLTLPVEVEAFGCAEDLFAAVDPAAAACVVMDLELPGVGGLSVVRRLCAGERRVPVIVLTSHGDVPTAVAAMKAGAADFIQKPFVDRALVECVRQHVSPGEH